MAVCNVGVGLTVAGIRPFRPRRGFAPGPAPGAGGQGALRGVRNLLLYFSGCSAVGMGQLCSVHTSQT